MRGGPWTSASISAAADWQDQHDRLVKALGCDTCEGRRLLFQGQVVTTGNDEEDEEGQCIQMPTRWLDDDHSAPVPTDRARPPASAYRGKRERRSVAF